jgi:hypothetical protein
VGLAIAVVLEEQIANEEPEPIGRCFSEHTLQNATLLSIPSFTAVTLCWPGTADRGTIPKVTLGTWKLSLSVPLKRVVLCHRAPPERVKMC